MYLSTVSPGVVETPSVGNIVTCQLKQVVESSQAIVVATHFGLGRVDITDISDHYVKEPLKAVGKHLGEYVRCLHIYVYHSVPSQCPWALAIH